MFDRRSFGKIVGVGAAGATLAGWSSGSAAAVGGTEPAAGAGHTSFGRLKQIRAGELNVGYAEVGPARGPVVICLHGWPYDIHSFADVAPLLAARGLATACRGVRTRSS
ncbi:alpha/beta fold hydrolase [Streptomyces sp. HC307]|uniref:alpha/beta fold hydrolase n=1 Tax=Streptomyces flavusporus TaxID=3385496 RepID=UPI0039170D2E